MTLRRTRSLTLVAALVAGTGFAACGPMPGYRPPAPSEDDAPYGAEPKGPPAPMAPDDDSESYADDDEGWETPPEERPPAPVYRAPEPVPQRLEPTPSTRVAPPSATPVPAGGVRVIELDKDSAYIIDSARNLCFFRYQATITPIDCARLGDHASPAPQPAAPQPAAPLPTAPTPQPPQRSGAFSADEVARFQTAFSAIFCDRVAQRATPAEQRIREAGLDTGRYEAIEAWMAEDDKRWWDATDKARLSCPR